MDTRQQIVDWAGQWINTPREVLPLVDFWNSATGKRDLCMPRVSWCGVFTLAALHSSGVARDTLWVIGRGYLYRLGRTLTPQQGDILYIDKPYQHHGIVESSDGSTVTSIDGNLGGRVKRITRSVSGIAFFNIEPFIVYQ